MAISDVKHLDLVLVTWDDAASVDQWRPIEDAASDKPAIIETVGFVVYNDRSHLTLAGSYYDRTVCSTMLIPRAVVKSVKVLRKAKK